MCRSVHVDVRWLCAAVLAYTHVRMDGCERERDKQCVRACRASVNDWLQCKMIGTAEINSKAGNGLHNSSCYGIFSVGTQPPLQRVCTSKRVHHREEKCTLPFHLYPKHPVLVSELSNVREVPGKQHFPHLRVRRKQLDLRRCD